MYSSPSMTSMSIHLILDPFSAKALSPFKFVVDNREECLSHFQEIAKLKDSSILNKTFLNTISDNPFSTSGFCPLKIVCSYIYITK